MAIEIKINKEINNYKENIFFRSDTASVCVLGRSGGNRCGGLFRMCPCSGGRSCELDLYPVCSAYGCCRFH